MYMGEPMMLAEYRVMQPLNGKPDSRLWAISALGRDASNNPPTILARPGRDDLSINATIGEERRWKNIIVGRTSS